MTQYETALKLWNFVFWISVVGLFVTMLSVYFFVYMGVEISWILWGSIGFYLLGGVNAQIFIKVIEKEQEKENE